MYQGRPHRPPSITEIAFRRWCLHLEDSNDLVRARIHDHDFLFIDEIEETAPFRVNIDDHPRYRDQFYGAWHHRAYIDREVDVGDARHVAAAEYGLADSRALLRRRHRGARTAADTLALGLVSAAAPL